MTPPDAAKAAAEFAANYVTINGRPPHRPDVLAHAFECGVAWREEQDRELHKDRADDWKRIQNAERECERLKAELAEVGRESLEINGGLLNKCERLERALEVARAHVDPSLNITNAVANAVHSKIDRILRGEDE